MIRMTLLERCPMKMPQYFDSISDIQHEEDEKIFWFIAVAGCPSGCLCIRSELEELYV